MFKNNTESDFYQLKYVARGRLSPDEISAFFLATLIYSGIVTAVVACGSINNINITNPIWKCILKADLWILLIHLLIVIFFLKEKHYIKYQKLQIVILNIIAFKMSIEFYQPYFLACEDKGAPPFIATSGKIVLFGGVLFLVISSIRAAKRVKQGQFRQEGKGLFDFKQSKVYAGSSLIFGLVMFGGVIGRTLSNTSNMKGTIGGLIFMLFIGALIQYGMALAMPEFFLVTYGKFRFQSFNMEPVKRIKTKSK